MNGFDLGAYFGGRALIAAVVLAAVSALIGFGLAAVAWSADLVPEQTPDGYAALVAAFPADATQVCITREDSPGEPECRVRGKSQGAPPVALFLRKLEPGSVYCAYSVNELGRSPLSEDCWVGPAVVEEVAK